MTLTDRLAAMEERLLAACARAGRRRDDINIIAVTKYTTLAVMRELLACGLTHLGENRWQDAKQKWHALEEEYAQEHVQQQVHVRQQEHVQQQEQAHQLVQERASASQERPTWHFIGSLQTNKVKDVVGRFSYIHSLDRLPLLEAIDRRAAQLNIEVPCFVQVNVSGEASKHGLSPAELESFATAAAQCHNVRIAGLMTMAPYESQAEQTRPVFRSLRTLRDRLNAQAILPYEVRELSMGMSNDFETAVEEGATWLRLGTLLVGPKEEEQ